MNDQKEKNGGFCPGLNETTRGMQSSRRNHECRSGKNKSKATGESLGDLEADLGGGTPSMRRKEQGSYRGGFWYEGNPFRRHMEDIEKILKDIDEQTRERSRK